jgi:hypothetical protein
VRQWSRADGQPQALRRAVDRMALWAVEILQP